MAFLLVGGLFPTSSQEGFHPDYQLGNGEGLLEVVIGPKVESGDNIVHGGLCSQEQDGRFLVALADGFHHIETGHLGHHHVHHQDVGTDFKVSAQAFRSVIGQLDGEVHRLQGVSHDAGERPFVLYQQYLVGHRFFTSFRMTGGNSMVNVLPLPGSLSTDIWPSCFSTMVFAKKRPIP